MTSKILLSAFLFLLIIQCKGQCSYLSISSGWRHTVAIGKDSTLWAWGENFYGQLGSGDFQDVNRPKKVNNEKGWVMASAGGYFSVVLKNDGSIWSSGFNDEGQLGVGTTITTGTFAKISTINRWKYVSAGFDYCIAIKDDGTLWGWGFIKSGFDGGKKDTSSTPKQLFAEGNWIQVETGEESGREYSILALKKRWKFILLGIQR
ncbi:MAG: hypothetical protein IPP06_05300 [Saprospiraceae bacterium]|nr:hypothetical protein [Candidatus Vicinibacter affinis]